MWSLCCAFIALPADSISSCCCNQQLIKLQWEIPEGKQAQTIILTSIEILTPIEILHKVIYKVVFFHLKHGAAINVQPMYVLAHLFYHTWCVCCMYSYVRQLLLYELLAYSSKSTHARNWTHQWKGCTTYNGRSARAPTCQPEVLVFAGSCVIRVSGR